MAEKGPLFVPHEKAGILMRLFGINGGLAESLRKRSKTMHANETIEKRRQEAQEEDTDERP